MIKDENYLSFVRGQKDAIEDLCHELAHGFGTNSVIENLKAKAATKITPESDGQYGTGYGLILSIATFISSLRELFKR